MATASESERKRDDDFEILDLSDKGWLQNLSKGSVTQQLVVGSASGWCVGYLFGRVGKAAAAGLGGSLLIIQIAHHKGYINVNWKKFEKDFNTAKKQINKTSNNVLPGLLGEVNWKKAEDFFKKNMFLVGGFTAGFFLGMAT